MLPQPANPAAATGSSSIYKQLHKHKRLAGIGLRFNNSSQQRDPIHEAEEDQADDADEIREDREESDDDKSSADDADAGSQEEEDSDEAEEEDSQQAQSMNQEAAGAGARHRNQMTPVQWHQNLQTGDQVS